MASFSEDVTIQGDLIVTGAKPEYERTYLQTDTQRWYPLPFEKWRVFDAYATALPGTSAADDLGLYAGAHGTGNPYLATYDVKAAGALSFKARATFELPPEYVTGQAAELRFHAGMLTTIANVSATIDAAVYRAGNNTLITGADLVTTAAQSINSLTFATKDFTLDPTALARGELLDILLTISVNDAATATAVIAAVARAGLLLSIKG